MARQASIVIGAGRYRDAAIILMRNGYPVGQAVVLDVYESGGETRVKLALTLPEDIYATRVESADLSDEWIADREREFACDAGHIGVNGTHNGTHNGTPGASGTYRLDRDPRRASGAQGGTKGGESSARWRKPDRADGRPGHNGKRW